MTLIYHEIALFCVAVSPSETADIYWPPMFIDPTVAPSLTELWGKRCLRLFVPNPASSLADDSRYIASLRWHQLFRAPLGFCGYQLSQSLGFPRPVSLCVHFLPFIPLFSSSCRPRSRREHSIDFPRYLPSFTFSSPRMSTFFLSAFLHHVAISGQGFDDATYGPTWPLPLFFMMQGFGVIAEGQSQASKRCP